MRASTDWFRDARWGGFIHYLADVASAQQATEVPVEDWYRRIDGVNVERLAAQLAEAGAGYCVLTLGQNSGYFLSPNATYDALVGRRPSRLSPRDLLADFAAALGRYGIRALAYVPSHAPAYDPLAVQGLRCTPPWDASAWQLRPGTYLIEGEVDARLSEFQRHWEAVIAEWSTRWGKAVSGWWFDGCYHADRMYRGDAEPSFRTLAAAAKAGNPDSIVAFNPGIKVPIVCHSEFEDYTAGELSGVFPVADQWRPLSRFVDGAQYHALSYLGRTWGQGSPRFSDPFVCGYTIDVNRFGGVVSWDFPVERDGTIPAAFLAQLKAIGAATRAAVEV
ncbi:MAG: hypothetical protein HUU35_19235 [Armatimonadetes bacterium]|nr:hypothetical protein [Armatimonadota bacterium]